VTQSPKATDAENDARARQQELEEELEAYTRKGIVSPSFMKAVRWFSRILYYAQQQQRRMGTNSTGWVIRNQLQRC
jgi:hypothetical protein